MTAGSMIRRLKQLTAASAFALGCLHIGLTFFLYNSYNLEALWFIGAGLAMTTAALSNFAERKELPRFPLALIIQNFTMTVYFASAWFTLLAPQVIIGFALFTVLLTLSLMKPPKEQSKT